MTRPFLKVGIIGLLMISFGLYLMSVFPKQAEKLPSGFSTPIIAFEFVQTKAEVLDLFGKADTLQRRQLLEKMDFGNRMDYIYMILYSSFLFFFALICKRTRGKSIYNLGALIALVILVGDAMENVQLLSITEKLATDDFSPEIIRLQFWTWIKWGGISIFFLSLVPYFLKRGLVAKFMALCAIISFGLALASYYNRSLFTEIYVQSVMGLFLMLLIYSFFSKQKTKG